MVAVIAESFHVLPSEVARDLDEDPEQLSLLCIPLLKYAEAKRAFDAAKDPKDLEPWRTSVMMALVKRNAASLSDDRKAKRQEAVLEAAAEKK